MSDFTAPETQRLTLQGVDPEYAATILHEAGFETVALARETLGAALIFHVALLARVCELEKESDARAWRRMGDDL